MFSQKTAFTVGVFVLIGIAIALAAVLWIGMSRYMDTGTRYVAYFNESVQGLDVDSQVKYRGVNIGRVRKIQIAPDGRLVEVVFSVESNLKIEPDMYAQLKSAGITGIVFIGIDRKKDGESIDSPKLGFKPELPVIKTTPSDMKVLISGIHTVIEKVNNLDAKGISKRLKKTIDLINQNIDEAEIKEVSAKMQTSLEKINNILEKEKWDHLLASIDQAGQSFHRLSDNANETVDQIGSVFVNSEIQIKEALNEFKGSMDNIDRFVSQGNQLVDHTDNRLENIDRRLTQTLRNLEKASRNLNELLTLLADQPSQLVFVIPLPPKQLETHTIN